MHKPIIVTPWYCSYRLLEAMLQRNRQLATEYEWWVLYCRYPLLTAQDAMSDTRKAQMLCKELRCEWWDGGVELIPDQAITLWAAQLSYGWVPDQKIAMVSHDSAPDKKHFVDCLLIANREADFTMCKSHGKYPGVGIINASTLLQGQIESKKCKLIPEKNLRDLGGPDSEGGCFPLSLYDPEQLEYQNETKNKLGTNPMMSLWLESRQKK